MANPEHLEILKQGVDWWNAWREDHPNLRVDLEGAVLQNAEIGGTNLAGANLIQAYMVSANLHRANLAGASLVEANLAGANLSDADLRKADLSEANLSDVNLSRSDLSEANLGHAKLRFAHLRGADLAEAVLYSTSIGHIDLSCIDGLGDAKHRAPSTIGTDTLVETAQGLSQHRARQGEVEVFLRSAGVTEEYLEFFRAQIGQPIEFYSCFISYSHRDKTFARRIYDHLQVKGIRCWLDEHALVPGDDIYDAVDRGIRLSDKILLCCSRTALKDSWWVDDEIANALEKERELSEREGKKVRVLIPLNLDGFMFRPGWRSGYKATLKRRVAADFTGWEKDNAKFEAQLERVVQALRPHPDEP